MQRPSRIPRFSSSAQSHTPMMSQLNAQPHGSQAPAVMSNAQSSSNIANQVVQMPIIAMMMQSRDCILSIASRQSSIERASSISRASILKLGASGGVSSQNAAGGASDPLKGLNQIDMAQSICFQFNITNYQIKDLTKDPTTSVFFSIFEILVYLTGFNPVWNPELLKIQPSGQQTNQSKQMGSSQPNICHAGSGGNVAVDKNGMPVITNKQRIELVLFYLNFFEYPNIPKPSVFQTMTAGKNWTLLLYILYFLSINVKFISLLNPAKIIYSTDKDRKFIHEFFREMFRKTKSNFEFLNTEEFAKLREEAKESYRALLYQNLEWDQVNAEQEALKKEYEHLMTTANELDELQKEEERLLQQVKAEEAKVKKKHARLEDQKKTLLSLRKETAALNKKLVATEEEKATREIEYEKQMASASFKENLPQLHKQLLQELENLENVVCDFDNKQTEWGEKIAAITSLLKEKINRANEVVVQIRNESLIEIKDFPELDILDFNSQKPMIIKDYKDLIHNVRKEYNSKVCQLPQMASEIREQKNAIANRVSAFRMKSSSLETELKKIDNQLKDLKIRSENALADAKLRVSQTKNELCILERQMKAKDDELLSEQIKFKKDKEEQEKIMKEFEAQLDEIAREFAIEHLKLIEYEEQKMKEYNDFKQAEIARIREMTRQIKERNEIKRKQLEFHLVPK